MSRLELPSGGHAELRDPKLVPERLRRPVMRTYVTFLALFVDEVDGDGRPITDKLGRPVKSPPTTPEALDVASELNDVLALALIGSWSFDTPPSLEALQDLPGADYDAVRAAVSPLLQAVLPDFGPSGDQDSPTSP